MTSTAIAPTNTTTLTQSLIRSPNRRLAGSTRSSSIQKRPNV
ncbi:MAG TPA: hypothetical protein VHH09_04610 [Acidimicrobiales bacterium]|nr:hypothetical protein [Acidimicrobiales bacterium]